MGAGESRVEKTVLSLKNRALKKRDEVSDSPILYANARPRTFP